MVNYRDRVLPNDRDSGVSFRPFYSNKKKELELLVPGNIEREDSPTAGVQDNHSPGSILEPVEREDGVTEVCWFVQGRLFWMK